MASVWVLVATALLTLHQATSDPIVYAPWGQIRGKFSVSESGLNYFSFLGIPYALPPIGQLRFAKPVAHPGLEDGEVFDATTVGDQCLQLPSESTSTVAGFSEDCLTLNVYMPLSPSSVPKSVMVWIHKGGFTNGGAPTYTPSELVTDNDVIVVVIQYRLDAFGFLSCVEELVPGNFGLWDQNLAIHWVKTNIGAFGGDPESITVFGQSAGAASVGYQLLSPASKDLTFRAILQSGTPLAPWALNKNPCQAFFTLASETGCLDSEFGKRGASWWHQFLPEKLKRAERERVLACLRGLDASELIRPPPMQEGIPFITTLVWLPSEDGDFIPQSPAQLISNVTYLEEVGVTERDIVLGVTNDEAAGFVTFDDFFSDVRNSAEGRGELLRSLLAEQLRFLFGEDLRNEEILLDVLEFFYTQWSNNGDEAVSLQNISDAVSDIAFTLNTIMFVRGLASAKAQTGAFVSPLGRLYLYLFNHFPSFKEDMPELKGTAHTEDVEYEFDPVRELGGRRGFTDVENAIGSIFRTTLANFAKTGQPEVPLLNNNPGEVITWPVFTMTEQEYLSLERAPRVANRLFGSRVALWTELIPSLLNSTLAPKPTRFWVC